MNEKEKRKIVEFVGLEWHELKETYPYNHQTVSIFQICVCGWVMPDHTFSATDAETLYTAHLQDKQLDPLDPADMYGKIWPAFTNMKEESFGQHFITDILIKGKEIDVYDLVQGVYLLTSPPNLAQALLEYIEG